MHLSDVGDRCDMSEFCLRAIKLKISSASTHFIEELSEPDSGFESLLLAVWMKVKLTFWKLDRLLTAISYAEAGNLDAVKEILEQNKVMASDHKDKINMARSADNIFMCGTKHI